MPRYNVQRPLDGKWACFSTIVDDYITDFMSLPKYLDWREKEYGRTGNCPLSEANVMNYDEAERIRKVRKEWAERERSKK